MGVLGISTFIGGCQSPDSTSEVMEKKVDDSFEWQVEQFADIRVLRYQVPGWDQLTPKQRIYAYYLQQAGLAGRDMIWDQNYKYNLAIRHAIEDIVSTYSGNTDEAEYQEFMTWAKRVWFSNGIHHHYSNVKLEPGFSREFFEGLLNNAGTALQPEILTAIFDSTVDVKKVSKDANGDLLLNSAVNFYDSDISEKEVVGFYEAMIPKGNDKAISYGLNSKVIRKDGRLIEEVYSINGLYGASIAKVVENLEMAMKYAENEKQAQALALLIEYYKTGDLKTWDDYNIAWVQATEGDIDYINGFIEVYNDPLSFKGNYETVVQIKDFDASERMKVISENVQWFEDHSSILPEHKKENVVGVTYKIVNVVGEAGDASPSSPIGVNLPNANWIRQDYGSKSVSLGNIENAYHQSTGEGMLHEFAFDEAEIERAEKYAELAGKMHTALHEVVGHASGKINKGVGTPKETLKNYSSTLEEARADLVALYYLLDHKLVELGLIESEEVGKAEYDNYIRNGMMLQLRRLQPGENLEEDHMRNRQLVASWAYEKGLKENVIEKKVLDGKTYFVIRDYQKLRVLFGELLREIQRIKSEGDYQAGRNLVETYGVKVDPELHAEVLRRSSKLNIAPYAGFVNPVLTPVMENGEIVDIKLEYKGTFVEQMLEYGKLYGFLK